jgi:exodeoxyribonuclease-3
MRKYRFISWNVNGIRAVDKKAALKWIDTHPVDILGLQEIKAEASQIPNTIFEKEFRHAHINPSSNKGQSGVALYSDITPNFVGTAPEVDILDEGRINEFHFDQIAFFNVYFPNGQRSQERLEYKLAFYERFLQHIEMRRAEGKSIIICGDVNTAHNPIDLARPKANENTSGFLKCEREWIDKLLLYGYHDTFRLLHGEKPDCYSWWSYRARARENNVGWRIDYFFVSDDLANQVTDAFILDDIFGSDHCPVGIEITL